MHDSSQAGFLAAAVGAYMLFILGAVAIGVVINSRIASKAGYSGALSLLMLVPLANVVILFIFAFSEWPIERRLQAALAGLPPGPPGVGGTTLWQPGPSNPPATL